MVHSRLFQRVQSCPACEPIPLNDRLGMDFHRDQLLCLSQQFRSKYTNRRRPISDFVVLNFGDVDEDLGCRIVELDGFENCGTVVGHIYVSCRTGLQDLVHTLWSKGGLDEVADSEGTDERGETRIFGLFFGCLVIPQSASRIATCFLENGYFVAENLHRHRGVCFGERLILILYQDCST